MPFGMKAVEAIISATFTPSGHWTESPMPFGMKAVEADGAWKLTFAHDKTSPMPFGMKAVEAAPFSLEDYQSDKVTNAFRHEGR